MKTILTALALLVSMSAFASPVRLGAILSYQVDSADGKAGEGAQKCVPVQFELQDNGLFAAHLEWNTDLGLGLEQESLDIRQEMVQGQLQYFYSTGYKYGSEGASGGTYISSPAELLNHHFVNASHHTSRGSFITGIMIKSMDDQVWCRRHAG